MDRNQMLKIIKENERVDAARNGLFNAVGDVMAKEFPDYAWQMVVMLEYRNNGVWARSGNNWNPAYELASNANEPEITTDMWEVRSNITRAVDAKVQQAVKNIGYSAHWKMLFVRRQGAVNDKWLTCLQANVCSTFGFVAKTS